MKVTLSKIKNRNDVYEVVKKIADKYNEELMADLDEEIAILIAKTNNTEFTEEYYIVIEELVGIAKMICIGIGNVELKRRCLWASDNIDRYNGVIDQSTISIAAWHVINKESLVRLASEKGASYNETTFLGDILMALIDNTGKWDFNGAEELDKDTMEISYYKDKDGDLESAVYRYNDILDMVKYKLIKLNIGIKE